MRQLYGEVITIARGARAGYAAHMAKRCEVRIYQYRRSEVTVDGKGRARKLNKKPTHVFTVVGDSLEICRKDAQARAESILGKQPPFSTAFGVAPPGRFDKSIVITKRIPEGE